MSDSRPPLLCRCSLFTDCGYPCIAPPTQEDLLCDVCRPSDHPVFHYQPLAMVCDPRGLRPQEMGGPSPHRSLRRDPFLPPSCDPINVERRWLDQCWAYAYHPDVIPAPTPDPPYRFLYFRRVRHALHVIV